VVVVVVVVAVVAVFMDTMLAYYIHDLKNI
jgi:hypothetical protein